MAIINAHYDLAAMLLEKGADPNVADSAGMAALYALVDMNTLGDMQGRPQPKLVEQDRRPQALLQQLIEKGANPNPRLLRPILGRYHGSGDASLGEGTTPLLRAAKAVDVEMMRVLLDGRRRSHADQEGPHEGADARGCRVANRGSAGRPTPRAPSPRSSC